jgi:hypothetical protein
MEHIPITDNPDAKRRAEAERFGVFNKTAAYVLSAADHGKLFTATNAGSGVVFTLPAPVAGLEFSFQKAEATTDITLQAPAGSKVNYGTAGQVFKNITDADGVGYGAFVTIRCNGLDWFVLSGKGTWVNAAS